MILVDTSVIIGYLKKPDPKVLSIPSSPTESERQGKTLPLARHFSFSIRLGVQGTDLPKPLLRMPAHSIVNSMPRTSGLFSRKVGP